MTAAILSIGTELTRGELLNTNAAWLAEELTVVGYQVVETATVADDRERIGATINRLVGDVRVLIVTGGLGPTTDDLTTEAVASAVSVPTVRDQATVEHIRGRFAALGREMPESNLKQADFPKGATILRNEYGTAPGFFLKHENCHVFCLPGVPSEMKPMFLEQVLRVIGPMVERDSHQLHLRTFGLTESKVGQLLSGIEASTAGVTLGYRASFPEIEIKILARASSQVEAEKLAQRADAEVRQRLGEAVYGGKDDSYPAWVGRALRDKGLTVALAESCTGGMAASMLTSVPGSSDFLLFDGVVYANKAKQNVLGVGEEILRAHGAVSEEVAAAMAEGALRKVDADLSVSITGIAGPGGGTEHKPVGTVWFALARRGQPTVTKTRRLHGDRQRIRTLASYVALRMLAHAALGRALEEPLVTAESR